MQKYIGTKRILAKPMTRGNYIHYRGWTTPEDEDPNDEGYLVEYVDGGQANHPDHKGYISWSPKDVFEGAYYQTEGMTFGEAIEALKAGQKVQRVGWNGKGLWIVIADGTKGEVVDMTKGSNYERAGLAEVCIDPHIDMFTAQGTMQPGWLASQADMLASDWQVVE